LEWRLQTKKATSDEVTRTLRQIFRVVSINSKKLNKIIGLTGPQLLILKEVERIGKVTPGQIAREISLSQATVAGVIGRLENRNFLVRQRDKNDRRRVLVRITNPGKLIVERAQSLMKESFGKKIDDLPVWEKIMILSALQRLLDVMETSKIDTESSTGILPTSTKSVKFTGVPPAP
jgi:DNA-binding MarR family transcriptional regulator